MSGRDPDAVARDADRIVRQLGGKWHGVRGCDKTIFASDYPLLDLKTVVRDARAMGLDKERAQAFLHGNAQRLFWP